MSENVKHTPGPWKVEDPMGADVGLSIVQAGLKSYEWTFIAMVLQSEKDDSEEVGRIILPKEQQANARLIAAAPDLLEAVKGLVSQWNEFEASSGNMEEAYYKLAKYARSDWQKAIAALAKAGG